MQCTIHMKLSNKGWNRMLSANPLKTSINGTLPSLTAAFKLQHVPSISEMWYGCLERAPNHISKMMLVKNGLRTNFRFVTVTVNTYRPNILLTYIHSKYTLALIS